MTDATACINIQNNMSKRADIDRSTAAAILGRKGGQAGTGDSKRRSPAVIRKAVKARIAANKLRKQQEAQAS